MLKYNADTKVIFANDDAPAGPIREITSDEVADLLANGATVDTSAQSLVPQKPDAIDQAMLDVHPEEAGNGVAGSAPSDASVATDASAASTQSGNTASTSETAEPVPTADGGVAEQTAYTQSVSPAYQNLGAVAVAPVTPDGTPTAVAQPDAASVRDPNLPPPVAEGQPDAVAKPADEPELTENQKVIADSVAIANTPAPAADIANAQVTPVADEVKGANHPAHNALLAIEIFAERIPSDFMGTLKALVAEVRELL